MASWEEWVCTAKKAAASAGKKVIDASEVVRLRLQLAENERSVRDGMEGLGRLFYESRCTDTPPDEQVVAALMDHLKELKAKGRQLQAAIDGCCGRIRCACGATNPRDAAHCHACGKAL